MIHLMKWLSLLAVAYLYYQYYLIYESKYKFRCSFESFCVTQTDDLKRENDAHTIEYIQDKIVLTEDDESHLIHKYAEMEQSIKVKEGCAIGAGYTTCMDINFRAVDLFKALEPEIKEMIRQGQITPQVHDRISELREFVETFLYYFSMGANAERVSDSRDLFYLFLDNIKAHVKHRDELGGHSSVFALRSQIEQCKVFTAAQPTDFNFERIPLNEERAEKYLLWPQQNQKMTLQEKEKLKRSYDVHLVFEYNEGDIVLGFTAPRSNRFYFVHDPNGAYFKQMESYHADVKNYPEIKRHMFGGYQLMQKLSIQEAEQRLQKLDQLWKQMKVEADHRIHVEFAHFSRLDFFKLFEHYVVRNADSLGMNEQELIMLLDFWKNKLDDINAARDSKPSLEEILDQLKTFFKTVEEQNLSISRVHMHPYGSFILCYDKNKWEDGRDAIIKSSLTTPKYCMMTDDLREHVENYDIPERPLYIANPQNYGDVIKVDKHNLTYNFNLDEKIHCYLQFFMKCKKMIKTAGMGDTISSTGFIYQAPKGTFQGVANDFLSRTQYRGGASHTVHYHTNGTGRDTYIVRDNGGFCKMYEPNRYGDVGTFSSKRRPTGNAPTIHAKNIYYHANGTGRDSYIVTTSGGFNNIGKTIEYRQAFVNSLRQYERPLSAYTKLGGKSNGMRRTQSTNTFKHSIDAQQEIKKRDYLVESQLTFNSKFTEEQKNLRKSQKFMDERLAQPKRTRSKMPMATIQY